MIEAYPLQWPLGYPRTRFPFRHRTFKLESFDKMRKEMLAEFDRLKATNIVISSNVPLRQDGMPYAGFERRNIPDRGMAIYFKLDKEQRVLCCDQYDNWEDNMRAITKTVEAMRGLARWGVSDIMKRTFSGLTALPAPMQDENWWDVLATERSAPWKVIRAAYIFHANLTHPDVTRDDGSAFKRIQQAYFLAAKEKGERP